MNQYIGLAGGMPAMTLPFVLVLWIFLLASPLFSRLQPVGDA